jgi:predicted CXXCH cytochrome family protein
VEKYKIKYVLGSIWKQRYITEFPNGAMHVLPVQWNVLTEDWSDNFGLESQKPGDGSYWSDKGMMFQYQCMGCHTSGSKVTHDEAKDTYATRWVEMGVSCESCHGPGRAHVEADLPEKFDKILNPPRVPDPRRAAMVCGSCHDVGTSQDGQYAYPVNYKPGNELRFHLDKAPSQYPDGSPRTHHQQYNDWKSSGHARAGVMCWDCHSPHVRGKFNRFQLKLPGSLLCSTCHANVALKGAHSIHSTNNCIGCHMPNTVKSATAGDLRSHRMTVVRPEWTVKAGGDTAKQPNSCNLCHYHKDYEPERLVHFLYAVRKPEVCNNCHGDDDPEDYPY